MRPELRRQAAVVAADIGVPTLGSGAGLQGLRLTASPSCSLVGSQLA